MKREEILKVISAGADLSNVDLTGADLSNVDFTGADLSNADLTGANLGGANLTGADLTGADLSGADLDYSCLPLFCGSLKMKVDKRIACQIAYHLCSLQCEDEEFVEARNSILKFANQFHRVEECGELEKI